MKLQQAPKTKAPWKLEADGSAVTTEWYLWTRDLESAIDELLALHGTCRLYIPGDRRGCWILHRIIRRASNG